MTPGGGLDKQAVQLDLDDLHPGAAAFRVWPESGLRAWRFAAARRHVSSTGMQAGHREGGRGFFTGPEQVHLVLTTYAKGRPVESQGDISYGMPPQTLVWAVEVHAGAVHWDHSVPAGYTPPARPDTDYSVVMNGRTGYVSGQGEWTC
jgi:hypothetical protein